jgi:hypothetical protein
VRRWRLLGVAILLALFGGVGVQAWRSMAVPVPRMQTLPRAGIGVASIAVAGSHQPAAPLDPAVTLSAATTVASAPSSPAGAVAPAPGEVVMDLCGVGPLRVKLPEPGQKDESFEALPRSLGLYARNAVWPRILSALELAPDDRSRATALVLRASGVLDAEASTAQPHKPASNTLPWRLELARLARNSSDANVLRWALAACALAPDSDECQALSPTDLPRRAPDDGFHWLAAAFAPNTSTADRDAALQRAAQAPRFGQFPSVAPAVDAAVPMEVLPYLRNELLSIAIGVDAALSATDVQEPLFGLLKLCSKRQDHRVMCAELSEALATRGQTMAALDWAHALGKHNGWAPERLASVRKEANAVLSHLLVVMLGDGQPWSCAAVENTRQWIHDRARLGERAALQRKR